MKGKPKKKRPAHKPAVRKKPKPMKAKASIAKYY